VRGAFLALLLTLAFLPQAAFATDGAGAAKAEAASALIDRLQMERQLDAVFLGLKGLFAENVIASMTRSDKDGQMAGFFGALPGGRDRFAEILGDEFVTALRKRYPEFKQQAAAKYAEIFSAEELAQLNGFFGSGVGHKWLSNSPAIEQAMKEWGQKAGMQAGLEAMTSAMKRVSGEQNDEGRTR